MLNACLATDKLNKWQLHNDWLWETGVVVRGNYDIGWYNIKEDTLTAATAPYLSEWFPPSDCENTEEWFESEAGETASWLDPAWLTLTRRSSVPGEWSVSSLGVTLLKHKHKHQADYRHWILGRTRVYIPTAQTRQSYKYCVVRVLKSM